VLAGWWATRWGKRPPAAGAHEGETNFAVESLEPRLLLSGVLGNEDPYALRCDANPAPDLAPLAAIEIDSSICDSPTDPQFEGLQVSLAPSLSEAVQGGVEGSGSAEVLNGQPVELQISLDQPASVSLPGEGALATVVDDAQRSSDLVSGSSLLVDGNNQEPTTNNQPPRGLQMPVGYDSSSLSSSTEELTDILHVPNGPPAAGSLLPVTASGIIDIWDFQPQLLAEKGFSGLIIQGTDETDDTLIVDLSRGDVPIPVTFHGGAGGYDTLIIIGMAVGGYTPGPVFGDGTIQAGATSISFTGLEPVVINGASATGTSPAGLIRTATTLTFTTPGSTDVIIIDSPAEGQNRISGTSDGVAFESITFTNIQTVVIDTGAHDVAGADADEVTIASDLVATGLANLTITTGTGDDVLRVQTENVVLPVAGGLLSFNGGEGEDQIEGPAADITWNLTGPGAWSSRTSRAWLGGAAMILSPSPPTTLLTGKSTAASARRTNWTSRPSPFRWW
jgi:hypothetical protein